MNPALTFVIAFLILAFHIWASRRSPRFWFLGGIVPLVWFGLLAFLWSRGQISLPADWKIFFSCFGSRETWRPRKGNWSR